MEEAGHHQRPLHIAMFPWLATGHIVPFFQLAKRLARDHNHRISFLSTPRNLLRVPTIPPSLSSLITPVPLPFPQVPYLPPHAESTTDVPYIKEPLVKTAYDLLQPAVRSFLESTRPDWIIYDFASPWLPSLAAELGVGRAFLSLFSAATLVFMGPPEFLLDPPQSRRTIEGYTVSPEWVPFKSDVVAFKLYEIMNHGKYHRSEYTSDTSDSVRWGVTLRDSEVIAVRTCPELEEEWCSLLPKLHRKPLFPIGLMPPEPEEDSGGDDEKRKFIKGWLDKHKPSSVVYVALGTEAVLREEEVRKLANGLEESTLPFFWALRDPPESTRKAIEMLPPEFLRRVEGRGLVYTEWAPQVRMLSHGSVGGFMTHCGLNSVIEGLALGKALILLPMMNEQGLNARLLVSKRMGVEVGRNDFDGSFSAKSVAEAVRFAMADESGKSLRARAEEMKGLFGSQELNGMFLKEFVNYLEKHKS